MEKIRMEKEKYIKLHEEVVNIVSSFIPNWDKLSCSISVRKLYEHHGDRALRGIVGCKNWEEDTKSEHDVLARIIAHDLPMPGNEKADIVPQAFTYSEFY